MRLPSKIAVIIIIHGGVIHFTFNFTFHNILIYNRPTFNNRVVCCVLRESWQPVEANCKEFDKTSVLKIPTNRKI